MHKFTVQYQLSYILLNRPDSLTIIYIYVILVLVGVNLGSQLNVIKIYYVRFL